MSNRLPLNFIMSFSHEMIPDHGEDSYCYSFCDTAGIVGAFDGCGGAGARKHEFYSGHTEAYMASRLCAGAFYDWFRKLFPGEHSPERFAKEVFERQCLKRLVRYNPPKDDGFAIKGSMVRTLPTTAAVALVQQSDADGELSVSAIWAGDSRVYLLDSNGLAQLTVDDTTVPDPMETIYEDGVLKNILCSDKKAGLHCSVFNVRPPFAVFAATDGCFGYVSTPMEFEGLILENLLESANAAEWEEKLSAAIGGCAGDDYTFCLAAFGFDCFDNLKAIFKTRFEVLKTNYLDPVSKTDIEDRNSRFALWETYKQDYFRYLKDDRA